MHSLLKVLNNTTQTLLCCVAKCEVISGEAMRRGEDFPGDRLERLTNSCEEKRIKIGELKERGSSLESIIQGSDDGTLEETLNHLRFEMARVRCSIGQISLSKTL
jgi:hypothetical protein